VKNASSAKNAPVSGGRKLPLSAWCVVAAFGTYFCMYAFRRPFTAATYQGEGLWSVDYKTVLITAQVLGYTVSKFWGIKVVAEVQPHSRVSLLLGLIAAAEVSLFLFGLTPAPFNVVWLFCNGLPLGMVFGLVLGFLEGRSHSEALAAGLCSSFIVADGATKSTGAALLQSGVSEYWMPFLTGLLFVPPLLFFTWMLTRIPRPSPQDVTARSERAPMSRTERWGFFRRYAAGLTLLVLTYLLITILRSVRADFAPEIWAGLLGEAAPPALFTWTEIYVAAGVLLLIGSMVLIRDNRRAFFWGLAVSGTGVLLVGAAVTALQHEILSPFLFMVLHGIGLYLPYLAVQTTLFERLIALTRERANVGYLVYLADSFGYLGYVGVLFSRNLLQPAEDFLGFFTTLSWLVAGACLFLLVVCWRCFSTNPATRPKPVRASPLPVEEIAERTA
jgi:hypothetical protein